MVLSHMGRQDEVEVRLEVKDGDGNGENAKKEHDALCDWGALKSCIVSMITSNERGASRYLTSCSSTALQRRYSV